MVDSFGTVLRALRQQQGLNLAALASRTSFTAKYLGNIETGERKPTAKIAEVCDAVLGCAPLLATLVSIERGDPMLRRVLLGGTLGAATTALLTSVDGTAALAATLQAGLRTAIAEPGDWDQVAAGFARRHVLAPSPGFGAELAAQIAVATAQVAQGSTDAARGAALLSLTYGLWIGDTGRVPTAHGLYGTAAALADRSGDTATRALVRARAANRLVYEGGTAAQTSNAIAQALAISDTGAAALEAYAAQVHLCALTGDLTGGRQAVRRMQDAAQTMPEAEGPSPQQRVASFRAYLECRAGTIRDAERVWPDTERILAPVPMWSTDATLYYSRALVQAGRVSEGATMALEAAQALPEFTRILAIGVRDLLAVAPRDSTDEALHALHAYAAPGPVPWETLR